MDDVENRPDAFRDLVTFFPDVSKRWIAKNAHQGANVISNGLLDGTYKPPATTGDESMLEEMGEEEEEVAGAAAPAAAAAAAAAPPAAMEPRRSNRIRKRRESEEEDDAPVEIPRDARRGVGAGARRGRVAAKQRRLETLDEEKEEVDSDEEAMRLPVLKEEKSGRKKKEKQLVIVLDDTPPLPKPAPRARARLNATAIGAAHPATARKKKAVTPVTVSDDDDDEAVVVVAPAPRKNTVAPAPAPKTARALAPAPIEEPPVGAIEAEELRRMAQFVDLNKFAQLQSFFPEVSLGWLLQHADYSEDRLFDVLDTADRKLAPRADGNGATTIIQTALAARRTFECTVCFGDFEEHMAISCVYIKKRDSLMPGEVADAVRLAEKAAAAKKGRENVHHFCADCITGHARAAGEQQVIVAAGMGLKCMDPGCRNTLLRAHIEQVLDARTRAVIDPMLNDEALLAADCEDVERCQKCSFAAVMIGAPEDEPVFHCQNAACRHAHCRKCNRPYDEKHKGKKCEELDPEAIRKRVEEQLAEAAMFRCPRCKKPIEKIDGCNKIACPCGQLSCYVCKAAIKNYEHFQNGPTADGKPTTKCQLWVDPTANVQAARVRLLHEQIGEVEDAALKDMLQRLQ